MKLIYTILLALFILSCSNSNKGVVTPEKYLDEVFKIVEEHSIRRDSVDFKETKSKEYAKLKDTNSLDDCYPIITSILSNLGDHHSFFMPKEKVTEWKSTSKIDKSNEVLTFTSKLLNSNIGYIHMKGFSSGDSISIQKYANSLQNEIKSIDNVNLKGWILDLRENMGGNCWPMLTGLGPILGNGICGYFIDNNQEKSSWIYQDGESRIDSFIMAKVNIEPYSLLNNSNPVAVLTGNQTASSGEVIVIAFHNKSNTKSFGESTWGVSTGNAGFELSDGSKIFLTTSIYADRLGNIFGEKIKPDEIINFSYESIGQADDPVIKRAKDWIYEQ